MVVENRQAAERAYVDDLLGEMKDHAAIEVANHRVVGEWPDTELHVIFRVPQRSNCLYGIRNRLWDEGWIDAIAFKYMSAPARP